MVRWSWVNFQCQGVLPIWIKVGQGPTALAVGAGVFFLTFFSRLSFLFSFSLSLWKTTRYRLKYCLKGPLSPKQPTNRPTNSYGIFSKGLRNEFETAVVNEPSVFEPLKFYCIVKFCLLPLMTKQFKKEVHL